MKNVTVTERGQQNSEGAESERETWLHSVNLPVVASNKHFAYESTDQKASIMQNI